MFRRLGRLRRDVIFLSNGLSMLGRNLSATSPLTVDENGDGEMTVWEKW
jgi:hypothetical protein